MSISNVGVTINSHVAYDVSLNVEQSDTIRSQVLAQNKVVFYMFKKRPIQSMLT
jgi:hypothetical protein